MSLRLEYSLLERLSRYMKIRKPYVAGYFYPRERDVLEKDIEKAFLHELGPGEIPKVFNGFSHEVIGVISPHAGYVYSGHIAAHGYYLLANCGKPDVVFILGPNHQGAGDPISLSSYDAWETPLGIVKVNLELSKRLVARSGVVSFDDTAHLYEHSIEVQIPFLQYLFGSDFEIIPVSMLLQEPESASILGKSIASLIKESGLKAYVIASSDFTHYEEARKAESKDRPVIEKILSMDVKGFYNKVFETGATICGPGPIMTIMSTAGALGFSRPKLLKYANSGDVTGDYSSVVCYASIAFYRS